LDTLRFLATVGGAGGLRATYDVHFRFIGKRVMDFVLVSFLLGVTAKAPRAKIDWKSAFCNGVGQYQPNFRIHVEGDIPTNHLYTDW